MDTRFTSLFSHSKDVFFVTDTEGFILHVNKTFKRTFNYSEDELKGLNIDELRHPADNERWKESQTELLLNKELLGSQSRIKAKDGCYYNITWSTILNNDLIYSTGSLQIDGAVQLDLADTDIVQHTLQSLNEGFIVLDKDWNIIDFNPALQAMTNLCADEVRKVKFTDIESLGLIPKVLSEFKLSLSTKKSIQVQYLNEFSNSWLRINIYPYHDHIAAFIRDITEIKIQEWILGLERRVLELNTTSLYTLAQTTHELLKGIEGIFPDMICSIFEVDEAQEKLYNLASPKLPKAYCNMLEGAPVGPDQGSCGDAVYHRKQVIVSDIDNSPIWAPYADMIRPFGLKACWSTPVISSKGTKVLAVFGIYYATLREPNYGELQLIERVINILRVLIESKKNEENIKEQNNRLHAIANISSHELRRPVATIMGLVSLFDMGDMLNPMNKEIINHINYTSRELDDVIHNIVEKTVYMKSESVG